VTASGFRRFARAKDRAEWPVLRRVSGAGPCAALIQAAGFRRPKASKGRTAGSIGPSADAERSAQEQQAALTSRLLAPVGRALADQIGRNRSAMRDASYPSSNHGARRYAIVSGDFQ